MFDYVSGDGAGGGRDGRGHDAPVVAVAAVVASEKAATGHMAGRRHRVHHHKRHLSRPSSAGDYPSGNALINELGSPDNMFVTENGTVVTSQIGGTAILPCATTKLGMATVSTLLHMYIQVYIHRHRHTHTHACIHIIHKYIRTLAGSKSCE